VAPTGPFVRITASSWSQLITTTGARPCAPRKWDELKIVVTRGRRELHIAPKTPADVLGLSLRTDGIRNIRLKLVAGWSLPAPERLHRGHSGIGSRRAAA
jgi:hypothetical protein